MRGPSIVFRRILQKIATVLTRGDIPYMVIGGQAVLLYGEPRLTKDIDITLGIGVDGLPRVLAVVAGTGWNVLVEDPEDFVGRTMVLPVADPGSGIRIDFIFSHLEYERQAIQRAKAVAVGGRTSVNFATLEDVVVHKIVAGRARDMEDVRSILLKNPEYDRPYIERWLAEFERAVGGDLRGSFGKIVDEISR